MANENDEPQSQNRDSSKYNNQLSAGSGTAAGVLEKTFENNGADDDVRLDPSEDHNSNTVQSGTEELATGVKGKLNDLVADLYTSVLSNGATGTTSSGVASLGDYKNIRATAGPGNLSDTVASSSTNVPPPSHTQNTFSFKHFLSGGANTLHAPSSTVTSLDAPTTCAAVAVTTTNKATYSLQSSTGARPKVPQSSSFSVSATANSTLIGSLHAGGSAATESNASCTKMKRSPRFSSFDSQASLAGAAANANAEEEVASNSGCSGGFRLHPFTNSTSNAATSNPRQFEPCSYSHYDMQLSSGSPRRRLETIEARPNRLSLTPSTKQRVRLEAHCFPGELPSDAGPNRSCAADFPAAAAAAALPDFVQDHWMESWCPDVHWIENSKVCDFVQDLPTRSGRGVAGGNTAGSSAAAAVAAATSSASLDVANLLADEAEPPTQRLPDFLSDGPIIHSSQRLADVAAGLPSNLMNSPEDAALKQQLSDLRIENERQKRDLNEARSALTEQTRRSNDLERQLQELKRSDAAYKESSVSQNAVRAEENLEQAKRRQAAAQAHVRKLKQQVKQLTTEVDCLRRENESLREDGAVGGFNSNANCDRRCASRAAGAAASSARADGGGVGGALRNAIHPSRSQQISKDLLHAAANAENNLRQLLSGVENLRQMAADIEQADLRLEDDVSSDLFSDFLDECDDYEEYQGGPAL